MNRAYQNGQRLAEKVLQVKSGSMATLHRQALRQRVNRCWDLLQQQHQQSNAEGRLKTGQGE